jgi:cysteine desulfurase
MSHRPIYLDHHATTPLDPRVLEAMLPYLTEKFGNSASTSHAYGWEAQTAIQKARTVLAEAIGATPEEIIFTSGATEANNLAIKGIAEAYHQRGRHLITVQTEHRAILDPCRYLAGLGFEVTYLPVQSDGLIDLDKLEQAIRPDTILVSVMAANNEIGVLQPLAEISAICRDRQVLFHSDGAQAVAKIPLNVETLKLDLLSLTAHKIYGPKGIGALYVRRRNPRVTLAPQLHGGGQERGLRSGTLPTHQIVGFAEAVRLGIAEIADRNAHLQFLRDRLWQQIQPLGGIHLNGHPQHRLAGNLNFSVEGVDGSLLISELQAIAALSSSSACSSEALVSSHVLTALGRSPELARATLRIGLGNSNTYAEIEQFAQHLLDTIHALRHPALMVSP